MSACNIKTLQILDTSYSADSVEWCPITPCQHVFVCGTYHLVNKEEESKTNLEQDTPESNVESRCEQKKLGSLSLHMVDQYLSIHDLQILKVDAILDTKWCRKRIDSKVLLAAATAKGEVLVYDLSEKFNNSSDQGKTCYSLEMLTKTKVAPIGVPALSLDWQLNESSDITTSALVVVSDSDGVVSLLKFKEDSLIPSEKWKVHDFEAWIAAFDYWNPSILYSGGDDNKFVVLDSRSGIENPVLVNKSHEMGVTSIHCNEAKEHSLVTGSYDENLRSWDTRNIRKPVSVTKLIGGIWRLKWDPYTYDHLLAACMYGGFCIVDTIETLDPKVVAIYDKHGSIAYGCDWSYLSDHEIKEFVFDETYKNSSNRLSLIATCSFYDHKLCVSVVEMKCN